MNILIIGLGTVGGALYAALDIEGNRIEVVDPAVDPNISLSNIATVHQDWAPDFTFFCLPTPTVDGECHTDVIRSALILHKTVYPTSQVVIKSTMPPDKVWELHRIDDRIIYNPEFLRASTAEFDMIHPTVQVYGSADSGGLAHTLKDLFDQHSRIESPEHEIFCGLSEASLFKYAINTFLAMKVVWASEFATLLQLSDGVEWDWNTFQNHLGHEPRLGSSHMQVPGPDGLPGFGGACFPKDTEALRGYARTLQIPHDLLDCSIEVNKRYRGLSQ